MKDQVHSLVFIGGGLDSVPALGSLRTSVVVGSPSPLFNLDLIQGVDVDTEGYSYLDTLANDLEKIGDVHLKPQYVVLYTGEEDYDTGFWDYENGSLIYSSGSDVADFSHFHPTLLSYDEGKYRADVYPGWCSPFVMVDYDGELHAWFPKISSPMLTEMKKIDDLIENREVMLAIRNEQNEKINDISAIVVCFDKKINGVLPFQSNYIYDAISYKNLTKMSE